MPNLPAVHAHCTGFHDKVPVCHFIVLRPVTSSSCGLLITVHERCTNNKNRVLITKHVLLCHWVECNKSRYDHIEQDVRCQAKFLTCEISDFMPCAHARSHILHIKYVEKTDDQGSGFSVQVSVSGQDYNKENH